MTITELKEIYNKATTDNAKLKYDFPFDEYVKIESYIPIAAKIDIAQLSIDSDRFMMIYFTR